MRKYKSIGIIVFLLLLSFVLSSCTLGNILFDPINGVDLGESNVLDVVDGSPLIVIATRDRRYGQGECYYLVIFRDIRIKSRLDHLRYRGVLEPGPTMVDVRQSYQNDELKAFRLERIIVVLSNTGSVEVIPEAEYEQNKEKV